uniref:Uncharacterized protein n=1 Tax=Pararge aegeria TaxID=116150 RepID=S4PC14_9NEOP
MDMKPFRSENSSGICLGNSGTFCNSGIVFASACLSLSLIKSSRLTSFLFNSVSTTLEFSFSFFPGPVKISPTGDVTTSSSVLTQ